MKNSVNEHFHYYLHRNSQEEKELKITLARIDEAKYESLNKLRRNKESFVEKHSRRMFLLHTHRNQNVKWAVKPETQSNAGISKHNTKGLHNLTEELKRSQVYSEQRLLFRRERTTTISSVQVSSKNHPPRLERHLTEDCIKLPSITHMQACSRQRHESPPRSKPSLGLSSQTEKDSEDEKVDDVSDGMQDKTLSKVEKLVRTNSEMSIKSIIPGSKLELFRQLSHRVSTTSTWSYLLRNVFERLTNGQTNTAAVNVDKPLTNVYDELRSCRYLRMPLLHKITPTYSYDEDDIETIHNESDDDNDKD